MLKEPMAVFAPLHNQRYIALTTFRTDGEPVTSTVWFAQDEHKLYVATSATTGLVRRIHDNAQVEVAPCNAKGELLGERFEAMAIILAADEEAAAQLALNQKYGWHKRVKDLYDGLRGDAYVCLEITAM